jgi:hypothetical protein
VCVGESPRRSLGQMDWWWCSSRRRRRVREGRRLARTNGYCYGLLLGRWLLSAAVFFSVAKTSLHQLCILVGWTVAWWDDCYSSLSFRFVVSCSHLSGGSSPNLCGLNMVKFCHVRFLLVLVLDYLRLFVELVSVETYIGVVCWPVLVQLNRYVYALLLGWKIRCCYF